MLTPADEAAFAAATAEVHAFAVALPPPLPALCGRELDTLLAGHFAHIVALLPRLLCDLLPVPEFVAARLGAAQLLGWWHAAVRDALLDRQAPPEAALGGGLALLRSVAIFNSLGLPALPCWSLLEQLEARSAAAYARELASRPNTDLLTAAHVASWADEPVGQGHLVTERAASFHFAVYAQLDLAGAPADDRRRPALDTALGCLVVARQLADDAGDWPDDLRARRLSSASAPLAARLIAARGPVTLESLAAHLTVDEAYWEELWARHAARVAEGRAALAPFGPTRLAALLGAEADRAARAARAGAAWRAQARSLLGVGL